VPFYIATVRSRFSLVFLSLTLSAEPFACAAQQRSRQPESSCMVSHIVDGDTFHCRDGRKVRLTGIDSPEYGQTFGSLARHALLKMLPPGTAARLERDVALTDRYGRLLAYVWVGSTLVNEAMVRDGWAVLYTVPPNVKYAERFSRAQKEARARGTGLWAQRGFDCLPSEFRRGACVSSP
jgi:micrococcal nuclease